MNILFLDTNFTYPLCLFSLAASQQASVTVFRGTFVMRKATVLEFKAALT